MVKAYKVPGLRYGFRYYDQDDHGSVPLIAEYDALHFIFDGYKADLAKALARPAWVQEHFEEVSRRMGYAQQPPEFMLDLLGRQSTATDPAKAIEFFQMNTEAYPASAHAHAMLAGALAAKGEKGRAIAEYQKALELKPGRAPWKEALAKLQSAK